MRKIFKSLLAAYDWGDGFLSGSMSGLEDDTIGGFNTMLKEQQSVEGKAVVTTVLFDDQHELLHDRINFKPSLP